MAELGSLGGRTGRDIEVKTDMLDYAYVDECSKVDELHAILEVLESGKEGKYADLEAHVKKRILRLAPKTRVVGTKPTDEEQQAAQQDLDAWLKQPRGQSLREPEPTAPVRGKKKSAAVSTKSSTRLSGYDFEAWEKFKADDDDDDDARHDLSERRKTWRAERAAKLRDELRTRDLSEDVRNFLAERERSKGNEAYRAKDLEAAKHAYSRSLAYCEDSRVYSNRALVSLSQGNLDDAEADCDEALRLDPSYDKARARRAVTRYKRGKYDEALNDFDLVQASDARIDKLAAIARTKVNDSASSNGFVRIAIRDEEDAPVVPNEETTKVPVEDDEPPALTTKVPIQTEDEPPANEPVVEEPPLESELTKIPIVDEDEDSKNDDPPTERKIPIIIEEDDEQTSLAMNKGEPPKAVPVATTEEKDEPAETEPEVVPLEAFTTVHTTEEKPSTAAVKKTPVAPIEKTAPLPQKIVEPQIIEVSEDGATDISGPPPIEEKMSEEELKAKAEALKEEGTAAMKVNDYTKAVEMYSASLEYYSTVAARNNRCLAYLKLERWAELVADADIVLCLEPNNAKALFRRGIAHRNLGDRRASVADLSKLIAAQPKNTQAKQELEKTKRHFGGGTESLEFAPAAPPPPPPPPPPTKLVVEETVISPRPAAAPAPPPPAPNRHEERAARVRAMTLNSGLAALPPPAKTAYELEKHWRDFKNAPERRVAYVAQFTPSQLKKLVTHRLDIIVLGEILLAITALDDANKAYSLLLAASQTQSFDITLALLSAEHAAGVRRIAAALTDHTRSDKLLVAYKSLLAAHAASRPGSD